MLKVLADAPEGLSTSEIVGAAELSSRNATDLLLSRMAADGEIQRVKRGRYGVPGTRANLSLKNERQKDRQKPKPLKPQEDNNLSVNLSLCPEEGDQTDVGREPAGADTAKVVYLDRAAEIDTVVADFEGDPGSANLRTAIDALLALRQRHSTIMRLLERGVGQRGLHSTGAWLNLKGNADRESE